MPGRRHHQTRQEVVGKSLSSLETVDWTADGKGLFVSSIEEGGSSLFHVDLRGNAHRLWESKGTVEPSITAFVGGPLVPWAVPSPDGHQLRCKYVDDGEFLATF